MKPVAFDIDLTRRNTANLPNRGGFAVKYKCPSCGEEMCYYLGEKEKFCHECGESLFWGVVMYINSYMSDRLVEDKDGIYLKGLVSHINSLNESLAFEGPVYIAEEMKNETKSCG